MLIYKILRPAEWRDLQSAGTTLGSADDRADGFVHLSTAAQVPGTLARRFAAERDLVLLAVDAGAAELRWEPSRGGALFPHLYRPLALADVRWTRPIADGPDGPVAPAGLE
ncbi:MAG: DUF952 domain-containing protein [Amaricoccus sp.]